eukprot:COSAG02_NODE_741_length_17813_cov_51.487863_9_plen_67_part_00
MAIVLFSSCQLNKSHPLYIHAQYHKSVAPSSLGISWLDLIRELCFARPIILPSHLRRPRRASLQGY